MCVEISQTPTANDAIPRPWLLPADANITSDSTTIEVLVNEQACHGSQPTELERIVPPEITADDETVTVTIAVVPPTGDQTCPGIPPVPYTVDLGEPLGDRQLLDGSQTPPAPPAIQTEATPGPPRTATHRHRDSWDHPVSDRPHAPRHEYPDSQTNMKLDHPACHNPPVANYPILRTVVLDTTDARSLAEFYRELLGYSYRRGHEPPPSGRPDPAGQDWLVLIDPPGRERLGFQHVTELTPSTWPKPDVPQQLHLDLSVPNADELTAQHQRALSLGATLLLDRFDDPDEPLYAYADPAGHPFCILVAPPTG